MTVKKSYNVGETVWVYGINRSNARPTAGTVIKVIDLSDVGVFPEEQYIIEIPTHIEPLLEIRSWQTISQDPQGPVGALRNTGNIEPTIKFASKVGFAIDDNPELDTEDDEISPERIHAALERSQKDITHSPLNIKSEKPKRRYFKKKPKA